MLASAISQARVIPNGVDLSLFALGDQRAARAELAIPSERSVTLFAAQSPRTNVWKGL